MDIMQRVEAGDAARLSLSTVEAVSLSVMRLTCWVASLAADIEQACGWQLTHQGALYPGPAAISSDHLLMFMEQVRQATETTGMRA